MLATFSIMPSPKVSETVVEVRPPSPHSYSLRGTKIGATVAVQHDALAAPADRLDGFVVLYGQRGAIRYQPAATEDCESRF